ncbi:M15 family metallopeptidase [Rhodopila sp.]|uniref:M15 family metallopeptidase n=1 Tax=Rhodopila sp. TaxID=2480087 RepID=UPI003D1157F1
MTFQLSHHSLVNLQGVHPDLQKLVVRTLQISPLDFAIIEGLRTEEEEAQCVASGKSETMNSRHLTGKAVDFMAFVDGRGTWDDAPYHVIAEAFRQAAVELGIAIEWGGCWNCRLDQQPSADAAYSGYVAGRKALGKSCFTDLDHIQLDPTVYP